MADPLIKLSTIIEDASSHAQVPLDLLASIILKESGGNKWAHRFEPEFYSKRILPLERDDLSGHVPKSLPTLDTEKIDRATSFGMGQILGETARSRLHFGGDDLSELYDPSINVLLAAIYLADLASRTMWVQNADVKWRKVASLYNGTGPAAELYSQSISEIRKKELWKPMMEIFV